MPRRIEQTQLARLFDRDCVVEAAVPELCDEQLFPEERDCLSRSVDKRRAEFGTARVVARRALSQLGIAPLPLVPKPDRSPSWPQGVVGSITHTHGYCAVAVARATAFVSLGVDAEQDKSLKAELIESICTVREQSLLTAADAVVYFAAKEAFYKCQYPLTQQYLGFHDVELDLDLAAGEFRARIIKPEFDVPAWVPKLQGRFAREAGLVLCAMSFVR